MAQQKGREIILTVTVHLLVSLSTQAAPKACRRPVDLGFVIDASRNIGLRDFGRVKTVVKELLDWFDIKANRTHVSAISFSDDARVVLHFNGLNGKDITRENVAQLIDSLSAPSGEARVSKALRMANSELFSSKRGMRKNAAKVLFVTTDGKNTDELDFFAAEKISQASASLKAKGVHVYAIAIGDDYDLFNLLSIANDERSVFKIGSDSQLSGEKVQILKKICQNKG